MSHVTRRQVGGSGGIGDVVGPSSSIDGQLVLFNGTTGKLIKAADEIYLDGSGQTIGAVTDDLITLDLGAVAGAYSVQVRVIGYEDTTPAGCNYQIDGGARTTGAAAVLIGQSQELNEEAALTAAEVALVVSGNNLIVRVTGVAALTIDWKCSFQYIFQDKA